MPSPLTVTIEGVELPGLAGVEVGVQRRQEVVDRVPADADAATWTFEVTAKEVDGGYDVTGPYVHGRRGDRFVYLSWGMVGGEGHDRDDFAMFRRAKLHFADAAPDVLRRAVERGAIRCRVVLTDGRGDPRCAHVRAPDAIWSV